MKPYELIDGGLYKVGDKVVKYDWRNHQLNGRGDICCFYQECDGTLGVDIFDGVGLFGTNTLAIEPLPLTTEMLEKWGWEVKHPEDKKHTYWVIRRDGGSIIVHKNRGLVYAEISGMPHQDGFFCPHFHGHLYYAHELQQALHLCGLHDLANNLTMEEYICQ